MEIYHSLEEIQRLIEGFENGSWPATEWTHHAHLTMGLWYLSRHELPTAKALICDGIKKYRLARGEQNTDTDGYHETITLFYIWFVKKYLTTVDPKLSQVELTNNFCTQYGDYKLAFEYYSKDLLMSVEARRNWVEPDLQPLS
jgi:hypothetical protein